MEQLLPENWVYMHFTLILIITCVQMLIIYILGGSSSPPAGLSMYTVYFMAALLGWIAFTLQQGSAVDMAVDISSVTVIINTYILFLAAGARAGFHRGRYSMGVVCLAASLCGLLLPPQEMFIVQACTTTVFFLLAGLLSAWRGYRLSNLGDGIVAFAALIMCTSLPFTLYYLMGAKDPVMAQAVALGSYSCAYVLVAIGFMASVLIEYQDSLAQMTSRDPLSGVYNRRGMDEALRLSLASAQRKNTTTAAMMVDIDHLRQINASFGSDIGDKLIRQLASILNQQTRSSDVVARIDGERFIIVLPETPLKAARLLAERIRLAVGSHPQIVDEQKIAVTVSIGVTCAYGESSTDDLSQDALNAMYLAKKGGRNQVASIDHQSIRLSVNAVKD